MRRRRGRKQEKDLKDKLREMLPRITLSDFQDILSIAHKGHLRHLPDTIVLWQAVTTHIRHAHTDYDDLMEDGYDQHSARHFVLDAMNEKLAEWGSSRFLDASADTDNPNE